MRESCSAGNIPNKNPVSKETARAKRRTCVVGVGVVDHHSKVLPAIDRLKAAGHVVERICAGGNLFQRQAARNGRSAGSQQVIYIDSSGKSRCDRYLSQGSHHRKAHAGGFHLEPFGVEVSLAHPIGIYRSAARVGS